MIKHPGPASWVTSHGALEWRSRICPKPMVTALSLEALRLHRFYEDRIMPLAGGLYDQRNLYIEMMPLAAARLAAFHKGKAEKEANGN